MFIDINKIGEDGLSFDAELDLADLEDGAGQPLPVRGARVRGRAARTSDGFELSGHLDATVGLSCARCLEPFDTVLETDFALRPVADEPRSEPSDDPDDERDAALFHAPEGKADLREIATEQVYLGLPMKPICREGCKGLCPVCGANRNERECECPQEIEDPRLAPLRELKHRISDR